MKPLSVILAFIGLTVLGVLIAGCFVKKPAAALSKDVLFCIEIGGKTTYVPLKDSSDNGKKILHGKLDNAKKNGGACDITYLDNKPNSTPEPKFCEERAVTLKTDRVIKSELASNRGRDSSAANDPNVTWHVSSQDPKDIADIAALLNP